MSSKCTASGQGLSRTTNLPNGNLAYTIAGWVLMTSIASASSTYRALFDVDGGSSLGDVLYMTGDGAVPSIWVNNSTSAVGTSPITTTQWRFMAMVRESATRLLLYTDGKLDATNTTSVSGRAATSQMGIAQALSTSSGEDLKAGNFEDVRVWSRALTQWEILREMRSRVPNRQGLIGWVQARTPDEIGDYAVGGRWAVTGTMGRDHLVPMPRTWPKQRRVLSSPGGAHSISAGLASSTNTAFAVGKTKSKSVGQPSSANTAFQVTRRHSRTLGLASSSNTAFSVTHTKRKTLGLSSSTNTALHAAALRTRSVGLASSSNTAFALTHRKSKGVGLATSASTAFAVTFTGPPPTSGGSGLGNMNQRKKRFF